MFELALKDLDLLRKKRQALDEMMASNRISQQTYEYLSREISDALSDMEKYIESLSCRMRNRAESLEKQASLLEIFLANTEMLHAAGEIDIETYERQSKAISLGLESTRNEIAEIKQVLERLTTKPSVEVKCEEAAKATAETPQPTQPIEEKAPETLPQPMQ